MSRTAVRLLKVLRGYLRNINNNLSYVDYSDEEYRRQVNPLPGDVRGTEPQLLMWKDRIESLIRYIEERAESEDEESLRALDLMCSITSLAVNESFEKYEPVLTALAQQKLKQRDTARNSTQKAGENRAVRDAYIEKRNAELKISGFKGNRTVKITLELLQNGVSFSSETTVGRVLAKLNRPPSDCG